jgi:hypothetical protein
MKQVLFFIAFVGGMMLYSCQKETISDVANSDFSVTDRDSMNGHHHGNGGGHGHGGGHNHNDSTHVHNDSTHTHNDSLHAPHFPHDSLHHHIDTIGGGHHHQHGH